MYHPPMSGGQKTTPLFDLLSRGAAASTAAPAKPVVRVELKPQSAGSAVGPGPSPTRITASPEPHAQPGTLRVTNNAAYIAVAVTTLLLITAYIVGFKVGTAKEAARAEKDLAAAFGNRPSVIEPPANQPQAQPVKPTPDPGRQPQQPQGNQPGNAPLLATGPVLSRLGSIQDPRETGKNYLALVLSLPKSDCESAIRFLATKGTDAIAIPLDSGGNEANNPDPAVRYRLFVLPGFPAGELGSSAAQALEANVARLGPEWVREHRGSSDFRMPQWTKKK